MNPEKLFSNIIKQAQINKHVKTAVVNPTDKSSLEGAIEAAEKGLIEPILCGNSDEIIKVAATLKKDISKYKINHCNSEEEVLKTAIDLCRNNEAKLLMKGKIHTDHLMRAVVNKEYGLRTNSLINHIFALGIASYPKLLFMSDCALNIAPNLQQKGDIIKNCLVVLHKLGYKLPKVAVLSAIEVVNNKMPSSHDAYELAHNPTLKDNCIIEGPMAFDNAISKEAAIIKGMDSQVAGDVDLLVFPNIESGNTTFKSLVYLGQAVVAGLIIGAKVPIILTSRADSTLSRYLSVALACAYSN